MLLFKKLNSLILTFAMITPLLVSSLELRAQADSSLKLEIPTMSLAPQADDTNTQSLPAPQAAAPAAQVEMKWTTIKGEEIGKFVKNFHADIVKDEAGVHMKFDGGLIDKACANHFRIKLNEPSQDEGTTDYTISFEKNEMADKACDRDALKKCNRDSCLPVAAIDRDKVQLVDLSRATLVKVRVDNKEYGADDSRAVTLDDLSPQYGGPLLTPAAQAKLEKARIRKEKLEELFELCNEAKKGNREKGQEVVELAEELGIKLPENFLSNMDKLADDVEMKALEEKTSTISDASELNPLIENLAKFCKDHRDLKDRCRESILTMGAKANELAKSETDNKKFHSALLTSEKAIDAAIKLDPTNSSLRTGLASARLARYEWSASNSTKPNDSFYNAKTAREAEAMGNTMRQMAARTGDPEATNLAQKYAEDLYGAAPVQVPTASGTPQYIGTVAGKLNATYINATYEERFRQEKERAMFGNVSSGGNASQMSPSGAANAGPNSRFGN